MHVDNEGTCDREVEYSVPKKLERWCSFASTVESHIVHYVIPQYGDEGVDPASDYTYEECVRHIERYVKRAGKNSREGQNELDLIKIAHYAQMAYSKLTYQENTNA